MVLLGFSAVVSAVHVPQGTFLHSAVALIPHASLLAVLGLTAMVGWVAGRRPSWHVEAATRNFTLMVVGVFLATTVVASLITIGPGNASEVLAPRSWPRWRPRPTRPMCS